MRRTRLKYDLPVKILLTKKRIREWYEHYKGEVFVSFSGGKDSTVLLNIARTMYPKIPAIFVNTGMEYPEIQSFVKTFDNVEWLKPKNNFVEVIKKYGIPVISKSNACAISRYRKTKDSVQKYHRLNGWPNGKKGMIPKKWQYLIHAPFRISDYCCEIMKKNPIKKFMKKSGKFPMTGMMAIESDMRLRQYEKNGCNAFNLQSPISWPIAFWTEENIWEYIHMENISYSTIYDMGEKRTGCMFCLFGIQNEKNGKNRLQRMKKNHPLQYKFLIEKLRYNDVIDFINTGLKENEKIKYK